MRKSLAIWMVICLLFTYSGVTAFADDMPIHEHNQNGWICTQGDATKICIDHEHSEDCYTLGDPVDSLHDHAALGCPTDAAVTCGQEATDDSDHTDHTETCYKEVAACTHEHDTGCYEIVGEGDEEESVLNCQHVCDDGCFQNELDCPEGGLVPAHTHTAACETIEYTCGAAEHLSHELACYENKELKDESDIEHTSHDDSCYSQAWICWHAPEVTIDMSSPAESETYAIGTTFTFTADADFFAADGTTATYIWYANEMELAGDADGCTFIAESEGTVSISCVVALDGQEYVSNNMDLIITGGGAFTPIQNFTNTNGITINLFNYSAAVNGVSGAYNLGFFQAKNTIDDSDGLRDHGMGSTNNLVKTTLGSNGLPLATKNGAELTGLFGAAASTGKTRYEVSEQSDGLFQKDANGYFYYDSSKNAAYYNKQTKRFELYDYLLHPLNGSNDNGLIAQANFLPFSKAHPSSTTLAGTGTTKTVYNTLAKGNPYGAEYVTDLWFGMSVSFDFMQPKSGKIADDEAMKFEFKGDDDVWVFIDGVRVVDLGGTHVAESASINFATGEIINRGTKTTIKECFTNAGKSVSDFVGNTFSDYTKHEFSFFYMERGGNISYCSLKFNMPVVPKDSLFVTKKVEAAEDANMALITDVPFTFALELSDPGSATLKKAADQPFRVIASGDIGKQNVRTIRTGKTNAEGEFTLAHGETAEFRGIAANQYYRVSELGLDEGQYSEVKVEETSYSVNDSVPETGIRTPELLFGAKSAVTFTNLCTTENILPLAISKSMAGGKTSDDEFKFEVKFGEVPFDGTYTVNGEARSLVNGMVVIKAGETAVIEGIVGGTSYTVKEVLTGEKYKTPAFSVNGAEQVNGDTAEGIVEYDGEVQPDNNVTFINDYNASLIIQKKVADKDKATNGNSDPQFCFEVTIGDRDTETFYLSDGGSKIFYGLSAGDEYEVIETSMPMGYQYDKVVTGSAVGMLVDGENFVGVQNKVVLVDLSVKKVVTKNGAAVDPATVADTFGITVTRGGISETPNFKAGETKTVQVQPGTAYQVKETTYDANAYVNADGVQSGIVHAAGNVVTVTNKMLDTGLNISKVVSDKDRMTNGNEAFTFAVTIGGVAYNGQYTVDGATKTSVDGVITIKAGETANISKLKVGASYEVAEVNVPYGFAVEGTDTTSGTIGNENEKISFSVTNAIVGADLKITKRILNEDESERSNDTTPFSFKVMLGGKLYVGTYRIGDAAKTTLTDGTIILRHGETAIIEGVQVGTEVSVTEVNIPNSYSVMGEAVRETSIMPFIESDEGGDYDNLVEFTNLYTPTSPDPGPRPRPRPTPTPIPDPDVPLADLPVVKPDPTVVLPEPEVPLADIPQTGVNGDLAFNLMLLGLSLSGLLTVLFARKRKVQPFDKPFER